MIERVSIFILYIPESLRISNSRVPDSPRISSDLLWKYHSFFNYIRSQITWNFQFSGPWFTQNIQWSALKIITHFSIIYTFPNLLEFQVLGSLMHPEYQVIYFENVTLFSIIYVPESLGISSSRDPSSPRISSDLLWKISLTFQSYTFPNHFWFQVLGSLIHPEYPVIYFEKYRSRFQLYTFPNHLEFQVLGSLIHPENQVISFEIITFFSVT